MRRQDREAKRLLTPEQKYDLWVRMLSGRITQSRAGVDRSVISRLRAVARDGAHSNRLLSGVGSSVGHGCADGRGALAVVCDRYIQ